jgi:hypothetical protein
MKPLALLLALAGAALADGPPVKRVVGCCQGYNHPSVGCKTCEHCFYCGKKGRWGKRPDNSATCAVCNTGKRKPETGKAK